MIDSNEDAPFLFRVEHSLSKGGYQVQAARRRAEHLDVAVAVTVQTLPSGARIVGELMTLSETEAQSLLDELWRAGLRPSEIGTAGHLAATQDHLKDMRDIAFGLLRGDLPGAPR